MTPAEIYKTFSSQAPSDPDTAIYFDYLLGVFYQYRINLRGLDIADVGGVPMYELSFTNYPRWLWLAPSDYYPTMRTCLEEHQKSDPRQKS